MLFKLANKSQPLWHISVEVTVKFREIAIVNDDWPSVLQEVARAATNTVGAASKDSCKAAKAGKMRQTKEKRRHTDVFRRYIVVGPGLARREVLFLTHDIRLPFVLAWHGSPEPPRTLAKKSKRTPSDSSSPAVIFSPASAGPTPVRGGGSPAGVLPEDSIILQGYTFFVSATKDKSVKVGLRNSNTATLAAAAAATTFDILVCVWRATVDARLLISRFAAYHVDPGFNV